MSDQAQADAVRQVRTENLIKGGANWFFWIAGLSVVNTVFFLTDMDIMMVVGLGSSLFASAFAVGLGRAVFGAGSPIPQMAGVLAALLVSGIMAAFGFFARQRKQWAFIVGAALYLLDGVLLLLLGDWFAALFHVLALAGIYKGYTALRSSGTAPAAPPGLQPVRPSPVVTPSLATAPPPDIAPAPARPAASEAAMDEYRGAGSQG